MEINGILSGLTPKATSHGRDIEVKITIAFDSDVMATLATYFNEPVRAEVTSDVQELEDNGGEHVTEFEARRQ